MIPVLSVIIPAHNSETTISHSIESVLSQSYKNLEIIIVNDASSDNTEQILRAYEAHNNIRLITNNKNLGPGISRTVGLNAVDSQTEYVAFLDSDDWLDDDCYEKAISIMDNNTQVSICFWNINNVYGRTASSPRYSYDHSSIITAMNALDMYSRRHKQKAYLSPIIGNKVLRHNIIKDNKLSFNGWYFEDDIFMFDYLLHSEMVGILNTCTLYYLQREDSLLHTVGPAMIQEFFTSFSDYKNRLILQDKWEYVKPFYYSYCEKCLLNLVRWVKQSSNTDQDKSTYYINIINGICRKLNMQDYSKYCDISQLFNV